MAGFKRRSGRSLPAEDTQFLLPGASGARPKPRQRARRLPAFIGDDSESIIELGVGDLNLRDDEMGMKSSSRKGKGRAK
jgi:hypothetical protein